MKFYYVIQFIVSILAFLTGYIVGSRSRAKAVFLFDSILKQIYQLVRAENYKGLEMFLAKVCGHYTRTDANEMHNRRD